MDCYWQPREREAPQNIAVDWVLKYYNDISAFIGDTVTFTYTAGHNVHLHSSGSCDDTGSTEVGGDMASPAAYTFTEAGLFTFACQTSSHCSAGMLITFNVTASGVHCNISSICMQPGNGTALGEASWTVPLQSWDTHCRRPVSGCMDSTSDFFVPDAIYHTPQTCAFTRCPNITSTALLDCERWLVTNGDVADNQDWNVTTPIGRCTVIANGATTVGLERDCPLDTGECDGGDSPASTSRTACDGAGTCTATANNSKTIGLEPACDGVGSWIGNAGVFTSNYTWVKGLPPAEVAPSTYAVQVNLFVGSTTWEPNDFIRIWAEVDENPEPVILFSTQVRQFYCCKYEAFGV